MDDSCAGSCMLSAEYYTKRATYNEVQGKRIVNLHLQELYDSARRKQCLFHKFVVINSQSGGTGRRVVIATFRRSLVCLMMNRVW